MKKIKHYFYVLIILFLSIKSFGQVTGIQTIPGTYPTLTALIADLNTVGIGPGGATINVAAGYTEALSAPLVLTISMNTTSASSPLVIQKSGAGVNPLVTAHSGTSTTIDGVFILNGVDYVTIDGIDLQENIANTTPTTQMEWGYALLKTSTVDGSQYNTIKNVSVTLNKANTASVAIYLGNHTTSTTTALSVSNAAGTSSFNKFCNNTLQNCYGGYSLTGEGSASVYDFYDQGNQIGRDGVGTNRSQITDFGGGSTAVNAIFATNQNAIKIFGTNINGGNGSTGSVTGINLLTGRNSNVDIYDDTITLVSASVSGSSMAGISNTMGSSLGGNTVNIYNNIVDGCTYPTNTSGIFRGIISTANASYTNIYSNKVTNNTIPGTGEFSGIYHGGSTTMSLHDNSIIGNNKTGTSGNFYALTSTGATTTLSLFNNQITNNSASTTSGVVYGYQNISDGIQHAIYNNTIGNLTGGTGNVYAIYIASSTQGGNYDVYQNTIHTITAGSSTAVGGIFVNSPALNAPTYNIDKNSIYNLSNATATGANPAIFGVQVGSNTQALVNVTNNYISDLKAPNASNVNAIIGISLDASSIPAMNVFYNTVYINASSIGANFGTAGVNCSVNAFIDIRNNILVNTSTSNGTGLTRALGRTTNLLTNYALTSGSNCLYAGIPSAANLLFWDGTNSCQTIKSFKDLVGPREQASVTTLPPFVNIVITPYDLHLQTSIATQCESGGTTIAGFTTDFDGNTRNASNPDIGADEITGITTDIAPPNILYNPLTNSSVAATRTLTNFATITDPSGVNTSIGTNPRLYYKLSTNVNTYNSNTNATDGWKYVEATNAGSPFNFTIDYSLLFGGAGVVAGNIIHYFVVAQDLNNTPIVGINCGGFTTTPSSVNLTAANFPITNTINQYTIVSTTLSGTINVGPTELITSLTNAGGAFQKINTSVLSGNLTLNITGDLTAELGTYSLKQWAEEGIGNYTITIAPSAATIRTISGGPSSTLVLLDGADRVVIDGRYAGSGRYLRFRGTSTNYSTIGFLNDAQNNTLKYCIVESGNTSTSTSAGAIMMAPAFGPIGSTNGNDNNTISHCELRGRSDNAATPAMLINCRGREGSITAYNDNCVIDNNDFHDWFLQNSNAQFALNISLGNSGFTITNNSFYQTTVRNNTIDGAVMKAINIEFYSPINSNGGFDVSNNFIGGSASGATGSDMVLTVSGAGSHAFHGITMNTGLIPNSVQNNTIRKINFFTSPTSVNPTLWSGINVINGNYSTISGNTIGDATINGSLKFTINAGVYFNTYFFGIKANVLNGAINVNNNTVAGITINGPTSLRGINADWIWLNGALTGSNSVVGNTIGSTTIPNSIQNNLTTPSSQTSGIRIGVSSGNSIVSNNTVANITDNSISDLSVHYGIYFSSTNGSTGTLTISNNSIRNLTSASTYLLIGLNIENVRGANHTINGNTISNLSLSNTGAFSPYLAGIKLLGNSFGGTVNSNRIYNLSNKNTGLAPYIEGICFSALTEWSVNNNMITIYNGTNTNKVQLRAVADYGTQALAFNHNSIYVGGTATGTADSYCYYGNTGTTSFYNNLLYNKRTGGTGSNYAIGTNSLSNTFNSNNNAFVVVDTTKIAAYYFTSFNLNSWRTSYGGDANSIREITTTVPSAALFVNTTTGDLHINTSTFPEALGTPVIGVATDYDGDARSISTPTIGADEMPCSPIVFALNTQVNVTCNGGNNGSASVVGTGGNGLTYSWSSGGGTAISATGLAPGSYTCTITNICGNTGNVPVTITQPAAIALSQSPTICVGESLTVGVNTYTTNGTYVDTLIAINGCDSTVTTNLTVSPAITSSQTLSVCSGESVTVGGNTYITGGTYVDTLITINGCDSTVTTNLTVNPAIVSSQSFTFCAGESVTVGGNTYTIGGTYVDILTAINGCDSTVTTNLTVNPAIASSQSFTVCAGDSVTVGGNTYTTSGTYVDVLTAIDGCDSTVTTNLTVSPAIASSQSFTVCAGQSITVGGNTYTTSGTYVDVLTAVDGCDSTVTTNLTILGAVDASTTLNDVTISANQNGATYQWIDCGNSNAPIASATNQSYVPTFNGSYAVIVTLNGCSDTTDCTVITTIGLTETTFGDGLSVYPNPSNGIFTIEMTYASADAVITNAIGEFVKRITINKGLNIFDIQSEANGVYFINITSETKQQVIKLVKQL